MHTQIWVCYLFAVGMVKVSGGTSDLLTLRQEVHTLFFYLILNHLLFEPHRIIYFMRNLILSSTLLLSVVINSFAQDQKIISFNTDHYYQLTSGDEEMKYNDINCNWELVSSENLLYISVNGKVDVKRYSPDNFKTIQLSENKFMLKITWESEEMNFILTDDKYLKIKYCTNKIAEKEFKDVQIFTNYYSDNMLELLSN